MTQKLRHGSATQSGVGHFRVLRGSSGKILAPYGADFENFRAQWEEFYIFRALRGYFSEFSGPAGLCFSRLWAPQRHFLQISIARSLKAPNCTIAKRSKDTHAKKNDPFHILGRNVQKHAKKIMALKFEALLHRLTAKKNYYPKNSAQCARKKIMTQKSAQGSAKKKS